MLREPGYQLTCKPTIKLHKIYQYQLLKVKMLQARLDYSKLVKSVIVVCNLYTTNHQGILARIKSLRLDIRLVTKGTPVTHQQDALSSEVYISSNTEQLYNAEKALLKSTYRSVANRTHPDKGGSADLFIAVNEAYRQGDLVFLRELWLSLNHVNDLYWIQSEGLQYCLQEIERPTVSLHILKTSPLFQVARLHHIGRAEACEQSMLEYLRNQEVALQREFSHLVNCK